MTIHGEPIVETELYGAYRRREVHGLPPGDYLVKYVHPFLCRGPHASRRLPQLVATLAGLRHDNLEPVHALVVERDDERLGIVCGFVPGIVARFLTDHLARSPL